MAITVYVEGYESGSLGLGLGLGLGDAGYLLWSSMASHLLLWPTLGLSYDTNGISLFN